MNTNVDEKRLSGLELLVMLVVIGCIIFPTWEFIRLSLSELMQEWLNANWFASGLNILQSQHLWTIMAQ